jgi:hypothetical protein
MHPAYFETRFRLESALGQIAGAFVIVSAFATTGETWSEERNRTADESLRRRLIQMRKRHRRIVGYSPKTMHAEPSWLIEVDESAGLAIGAEFCQDAIYVVTADDLWVVLCADPTVREQVGSFRDRLDETDGAIPSCRSVGEAPRTSKSPSDGADPCGVETRA